MQIDFLDSYWNRWSILIDEIDNLSDKITIDKTVSNDYNHIDIAQFSPFLIESIVCVLRCGKDNESITINDFKLKIVYFGCPILNSTESLNNNQLQLISSKNKIRDNTVHQSKTPDEANKMFEEMLLFGMDGSHKHVFFRQLIDMPETYDKDNQTALISMYQNCTQEIYRIKYKLTSTIANIYHNIGLDLDPKFGQTSQPQELKNLWNFPAVRAEYTSNYWAKKRIIGSTLHGRSNSNSDICKDKNDEKTNNNDKNDDKFFTQIRPSLSSEAMKRAPVEIQASSAASNTNTNVATFDPRYWQFAQYFFNNLDRIFNDTEGNVEGWQKSLRNNGRDKDSLSKLQKVLSKQDFIRNGDDDRKTHLNRIYYYFTDTQAFGVNNLTFDGLEQLKRKVSIYEQAHAVVMFVSLSSFNEFSSLFTGDEFNANLIPYSNKKVYRNVLHQQLQLWSDICYLWKNNQSKLHSKSENTNTTNTKIYLILTKKRMFATKLNDGSNNNDANYNSLEICFGNQNQDWCDILQCGNILRKARNKYTKDMATWIDSINKDEDKQKFLIGKIDAIYQRLQMDDYYLLEMLPDRMSVSKLKARYFECVYLEKFFDHFFDSVSGEKWNTTKNIIIIIITSAIETKSAI